MLNQMTTMRLPDGAEVAFVDWQDKPLFSSVDLLDGFTDTEIDAFTYVVGDQVPATVNVATSRTANENDTNVSTPSSMASTEEMMVYAIKPEVLETQLNTPGDATTRSFQQGAGAPQPRTNRLAILNFFLLIRLVVSQKIEQAAPFGYFNTGFGPFGGGAAAAGPAAAQLNRGTPGFPTQEAVRSYVIPVHIGGQEKYRVTLLNSSGGFPAATPGGPGVPLGDNEDSPPGNDNDIMLTVRLHLDGLYKRPVT